MDTIEFRPGLLIPIYDHGDTIETLVDRLADHGLPIYIVDDGSGLATQTALARVALRYPQVRLARLAQNQGKGAAVMHGLRLAHAAGLTHALQVDADGQHDTRDVPHFLERGKARPTAVVCGQPIYDESAPKARLYGRYITHIWVWIETLSFAIKDSMCGFRLYPLAAACALLDQVAMPRRMDFDIAVLVRLAWMGVPLESVPTRVSYPAGGVSHFDMWRDNARISMMHTQLVCGMLLRMPILLRRKLASAWGRS